MLYYTLKKVFQVFFFVFFRITVKGKENIPKNSNYILCSNHISLFDPPLLACIIRKKIRFMAKKELFAYPVFGKLLKLLGAYPVNRGKADRTAIRTSINVLNSNGIVGIFPEGTRSINGELQKGELGVALIAIKSKSDVLPISIKGPYRMFKPVIVNIGSPIQVHKTKDLQKTTDNIMENIKLLLAN